MFTPTIAFWFSLTPLPIIWFLNTVVFWRMMQVRRLAHGRKIKRPKIYVNGTILNLISFFFVIMPALAEGRIFVQSPYWIIVYMSAGCINIIGLSMVSRGLELEIRSLRRNNKKRAKSRGSSASSSRKPLTATR